jgi:hypothetical protein
MLLSYQSWVKKQSVFWHSSINFFLENNPTSFLNWSKTSFVIFPLDIFTHASKSSSSSGIALLILIFENLCVVSRIKNIFLQDLTYR